MSTDSPRRPQRPSSHGPAGRLVRSAAVGSALLLAASPLACGSSGGERYDQQEKGITGALAQCSHVALQGANGKYVAAELDHGGRLMANRDWIDAWETFRVVCADEASAEPPPPEPEPGGFVTVGPDDQGRNRFLVDGGVFRHVGANINQLVYLPRDLARQELAFLQEAGIKQVRVWLPNDAYTTDEIIGRLRWVVDRTFYDYGGIRVTVALTHNFRQSVWAWEGRGGIHAPGQDAHANAFTPHPNGFYTLAYDGLWLLNDSWIDWGYKAYYQSFALSVVSELEDHPGIFAWDIANEVAASSHERWIVERLVDFYVDMAGAIKDEDPNHLVTTGLISTSWAGMTSPWSSRSSDCATPRSRRPSTASVTTTSGGTSPRIPATRWTRSSTGARRQTKGRTTGAPGIPRSRLASRAGMGGTRTSGGGGQTGWRTSSPGRTPLGFRLLVKAPGPTSNDETKSRTRSAA